MRILLDENFPLALLKALRDAGLESEHIIELGQRGLSDARILQRLSSEELLFLTQDADFLEVPGLSKSVILVSRVPQNLPTRARVAIWMRGIRAFLEDPGTARLFELDVQGRLRPCRVGRFGD